MAQEDQHNIPLREKDDDRLSDPKLLSNVAAGLAEIGGDLAEEELDVDPTPDDDSTVDDDTDADDSQADDTGSSDPTPDGEVDTDGGDGDGEALEIPSAYLRSAAHFGWTDADIADMCERAGTEHVVNMLRDLHSKDNKLTAEFADFGRRSKGETNDGGQTPPNVSNDDPPKRKRIDVEALREKYGEDDPIIDLVASQQDELARVQDDLRSVNDKLSNTQHAVTRQQLEAENAAKKTINSFFDNLEPYESFYGKLAEGATDWKDLKFAQQKNRDDVCVLADDIVCGARMRGSDMDIDEALQRAHAVISEPVAETVTRQKIMGEVEKRHKARVVRPSKSKSTSKVDAAAGGKPKNKKERIARANERLASLFSQGR